VTERLDEPALDLEPGGVDVGVVEERALVGPPPLRLGLLLGSA